MKKAIFLLLLLTSFVMTSQEEQSYLLNVSELKIKHGHDEQFTEGVKKFKSCYQGNQGTDKWNIWKRLQGNGNVYVLTSTMENWAEMDKDDEEQADKECQDIVKEFILPHIESSSYSIARSLPNLSRSPDENMRLVWVTFFDVNNTPEFQEIIEEINSAVKENEGKPRGVWYSYVGGAVGDPNFMISVPYKDFAELDMERDGPWEVMEKKHGKEKTGEIRSKFRNSVNNIWSYLYTLKEDLSLE